MDNIIDDLKKNGFLYFLTVTPVIISFVFHLLLQIPVIGALWLYAGPFTMLVYWGWVGSVYREKIKSPFWAILTGNIVGVVLLMIYIWQFVLLPVEKISYSISYLSQLFSLPLEFLTMWIGLLLEPDSNITTSITSNTVQFVGFLLMVIAFTIGYFVKKKGEKEED